MSDVHNVLIVGGGIAGLSLAIALRDADVTAHIVELKKVWTVYGVGIIQQSNVVRAMAQLGLLDHYLAASFPFDKTGIYDAEGNLLAMLPGKRLAGEQYPPNLGISRLALHKVLTTAAREKGATISLGLTLDSLEQTRNGVDVRFTDGTSRSYDLVVGADGIYSKVRTIIFPEAPQPRFTGQSVWRHNFPRPPEIDHLAAFKGPNGDAGLIPLSQNTMYMFVTSTEPGNPWMPPEQLHLLMRDRMTDFGGIIGRLRKEIVDPKQVVYKPMEVVMVPAPWFKGRVVLIGDAAHATTPHLGQGAGIAIEDALVLSQEMQRDIPIQGRLERFMERRYDRCKFIVESSEQMGIWHMNHIKGMDEIGAIEKMLEVTAQPI